MSLRQSEPTREQRVEARKRHKRAKVEARRALRKQSKALGIPVPTGVSAQNGTCPFKTTHEERAARREASMGQMDTFRRLWPVLKRRLAKVPDVRRPKSIDHAHSVLMLYGILMFVFQQSSRRAANRQMTQPQFLENVRLWFPEIEELPHQDTLNRVLMATEPSEIEGALIELIGELMRKKKFARYLVENCYPICMDGTQKLKRNDLVRGEWLTRTIHTAEGAQEQHYVYVLEVSLAFRNGMTLPLLSEFLTYAGGEETKQDCEQRAFHRVAERLKKAFPRLPILVLLDGLYANGPVMERCRRYRWQYLIVLKDGSLKSVWAEVKGLQKVTTGNQLKMTWRGRRQQFTWINDITYWYVVDGKEKHQRVHVAECEESWEEWDEAEGEVVTRTARHAWISSEPISSKNVHERCNLGARYRWSIEEGILAEKHHGYHYEHCYSEDWNAMRGYHYLMRIGHLINVLVWYSTALSRAVRSLGVQGFLQFVWTTLVGPWWDAEAVRASLCAPRQLRLV
jgi:hypothetical protein